MTILNHLNDFKNSINEVNWFIWIAFQIDSSWKYILSEKQRDFISESAYLKLFIAWENFLQNSYIEYMLWEPSISWKIIHRYISPNDSDHANGILLGCQRYIDWTNPEIIKKMSNLHFTVDNPFDVWISSMLNELFDMKTIRNAAAHFSITTAKPLDALASKKLGKICSNMKISELIFSLDPSSWSWETIFAVYINKLEICAEGIANG